MIALGPVIPVLRIFDEAKAREFYVDFLGFEIVFEHRFGENFPLYMAVRRADCVLHLSAHHGDGSPGAAIRIATGGIEQLARDLAAKDYRYAKPGAPVLQPWGALELTLTDPFGNRLIFSEVKS